MLTFARRPHYISDWVDGFKAHIHILAPSTYIFFASGGSCPSFLFAPVVVDHVLECARDFLPAQLSALAPKIVKRQIRPWTLGPGLPVAHNLCGSVSNLLVVI